ncbi:MAG: A/G-specific adenine glycosylase [Rhodospirillales bacterium]
MSKPSPAALLRWYDARHRAFPWRAPPGETPPTPYRVWLSEIMLQQTTAAAVIPYYQAFTARWPDVQTLAAAPLDDVLKAWAGLGYYARARNLHACARIVAHDLGGVFPDTEEGLRALPGIGPYTAAAIAAIAFGRRATPVDGNIKRVTARLFAVKTPLPKADAEIARFAETLTPRRRPGDFAQAMMDLGATLCSPRKPECSACPWAGACTARAEGNPAAYPVRAPKRPRPSRFGVCFWIEDAKGRVLVRRRSETGLLGGMTEIPSTPWTDAPWSNAAAARHAPLKLRKRPAEGEVTHVFTHFHLTLRVLRAKAPPGARAPKGCCWVRISALGAEALPSVMRKVVRLAANQES